MTTVVKTVAFNLQNMGKPLTTPNNDEDLDVTQYKSILHGNDFNQYQMGLQNKEIEGFHGRGALTNTSRSVLSQTQISNTQKQELAQLKQDYVLNHTRYNSLINTISAETDNSAKLQQLALLESTLDLLSKQINKLNDTLKNNVTSVNNQIDTNSAAREKYMKDITSNNTDESNMLNISNNIQNMLNDSDISTLQKNYSYILMSILAAAGILVAINVVKNN